MEFQECIRCGDWHKGDLYIRSKVRKAIKTLSEIDLIEVAITPEVCTVCRIAVGNECARTLLNIHRNENT